MTILFDKKIDFYLAKLLISPITNAIYMLYVWIYSVLDFLIIKNIKDHQWLCVFYFFYYIVLFILFFLISIINYVYLNCIFALKRPSLIFLFSLSLVVCYVLSGPLWYYIAMILSFMTNDPYNVINGLVINFILFSPLGIGISFNIFNPYFIITLLYVFIPSIITNLFAFNNYYDAIVLLPCCNDKYNVFSLMLTIGLCVNFIYLCGVFVGVFNVVNLSYVLNLELFFATVFIFFKNCEKIELCTNKNCLNVSYNKFYFTDCCFYKARYIDTECCILYDEVGYSYCWVI